MILTYQYRIKDSGSKASSLVKMAGAVNFVWNYCNETSLKAVRYDSKWLSGFDLNNLTAGASKELGIHSQTVQAIAEEYVTRRKQFKKRKLNWRSRKKSLSWIPFKTVGVVVSGDTVKYQGHTFSFWKSRELPGRIKTGSFNQDARGRWYVNFQCEAPDLKSGGTRVIGIDLGCHDQVACSDGVKYSRENLTKRYQEKLAKSQRSGHLKQTRNVHAKIQNKRKDWAHKTSLAIVQSSKFISVGDIGSARLMKTQMAKSMADAGLSQLKTMLRYKAVSHSVGYKEDSEWGTTVTCSTCLSKAGPSGLSGLSVRDWTCTKCGAVHDRDVNSALNHLRLGHETPVGNPLPQRRRKAA